MNKFFVYKIYKIYIMSKKSKYISKKIPKKIFITHKDMEFIEKYSVNWKNLNPDYEIKLYDNDRCKKFLKKHFSQKHLSVFNFIPDGPIKCDFWRVCVIYEYGGVYVDADIQPLVPLDEFINSSTRFLTCLTHASGGFIYNPHIIIAEKHNLILKQIIKKYLHFYKHKKPYDYWTWSICSMFHGNKILNSVDSLKNNPKYQFLQEYIGDPNDLRSVYCTYGDKIVLNNRYENYDAVGHKFTQ